MAFNIFIWAIALASHAACHSFGALFAVRFVSRLARLHPSSLISLLDSWNVRRINNSRFPHRYQYVLDTQGTIGSCWILVFDEWNWYLHVHLPLFVIHLDLEFVSISPNHGRNGDFWLVAHTSFHSSCMAVVSLVYRYPYVCHLNFILVWASCGPIAFYQC